MPIGNAPLKPNLSKKPAAPNIAFKTYRQHGGDVALRSAVEQMLHQAPADAA